MRINRLGHVAAGCALALGVAACNNDKITTVNQNPNNPTDAPAGAVFTNAAVSAVGRWLGGGYDLRGTEFVAQHLAEVQYPDEDRYARLNASSTQGYFEGAYSGELEDFRKVINKGLAEKAPGLYGPALTMRTWSFGYLTDSWGDVPYSEALRGDTAGGSLTPKYDAQKDIYADFFKVLLKAATDMKADAAGPTLGSADPIYGGDEGSWAKFANSLHARFALRLVNTDAATASTELRAALAAPGGVIETNADNATLAWPGDGIFDNPWASNFKTRDDHRLSQTLINIIVPNNDPRVPVYAMPTVDDPSKYAGMPNGLTASVAGTYFNTASRPGAIFYPGATAYGTYGGGGAKQPSYLMTAAEVLFIKAEAAERGLGGLAAGQAAAFYRAAISASMAQWGVSTANATSYLAQPGVTYAGGVAGLKQIAREKWVALYTDGGQAWAEWRRTCTPNTIVAGPAAVVNYVPRRFFYSSNEISINAANLSAAIARQGADNFATRVYWDKAGAPTC